MFIGLGSGFFSDNALFIHPSHEIMLDTEFGVPTLFKLLPLVFTISLSVIAIVLSEYLSTILIYFKLSRVGYNIFSFFNQRFLIELFYNRYITGIILKLGGQTTKVLDKGSVEYIGPYGLEKGLLNISNNIAKLSTGVITSYALYILIGLILYLLFYSYINSSIIILALLIGLSLSLHRNAYRDISIKISDVNGVILTSGLLEIFPVFEVLINASRDYIQITKDIELGIWKDLRHIDSDMRIIIDRLRETGDPIVLQALNDMSRMMHDLINSKDSLPRVNGNESYLYKYVDSYISGEKLKSLSHLSPYMTNEEIQILDVMKDTMKQAGWDFNELYAKKVQQSVILSNLDHSKLMMEVRWLLLDKPFDP
jgi:hypothetical protein